MARKIAVWYNLPSGGAKRALHGHLSGLRERGYRVTAFRPPVKQIEFSPIADVVDEEIEVPLDPFDLEPSFYPLRLLAAMKRSERLIESHRKHAQECAQLIDAGGFDLFFANTCKDNHAPTIGRYVKSIPKLLYLQEPHRPLYEPMPRLPWLAMPEEVEKGLSLRNVKARGRFRMEAKGAALMGREELANAKSYDRILVNSYFSREAVLRAYGISASVCYLGIDPGIFENRSLARENMAIGIGTFGPTKNIRLAIQAVGAIPKDRRPRLVWVANMTDPPYFDECVALARSLDVELVPKQMVPDEEVVDLLNRARAMIYAPRLEPFGFAPLEANFCGTPVVGVAEGGVRETVADGVNGLLADHDPVSLGASLQSLLADKDLWQELSEQGEKRARSEFSLSSGVDRLEAEIRRLVP